MIAATYQSSIAVSDHRRTSASAAPPSRRQKVLIGRASPPREHVGEQRSQTTSQGHSEIARFCTHDSDDSAAPAPQDASSDAPHATSSPANIRPVVRDAGAAR